MVTKSIFENMLNDDTKYTINVNRLNELEYLSKKMWNKFKLIVPEICDMKIFLLVVVPANKQFTIKELFEYFKEHNIKSRENTMEMIAMAIGTNYLKAV